MEIQESLEASEVQDPSTFKICKDANQLFKILLDRGFEFYEEENLIMCVLCNPMDNPNLRRKRDNRTGMFTFDVSKYMSDVEKEPS